MAKKKGSGGAAKGGKQAKKKIESIVEDKTFGLKNKSKSKKVQKYVENVKTSAKQRALGLNARELAMNEETKMMRKQMKKAKEAADMELSSLFKQVTSVAAKATADPTKPASEVLCNYFKMGLCKKGKRCKFSHDLSLERKVSKRSLYTDGNDKEKDNMEDWTQEKLEKVIASKGGANKGNETKIICKYFLKAIEELKYGWFWTCPNGSSCIYKHALPPGYVFAPKKKTEDVEAVSAEDASLILCEEIEEERKKLDLTKCTPVTPETFAAWKKRKKDQKEEQRRDEISKAIKKKGKNAQLSGRALFTFDPSLFVDDLDAGGAEDYEIDSDADFDEENEDNNSDDDDDNDNDNDNDNDDNGDGGDGDGDGDGDNDDDNSAGGDKDAGVAVQDASLFLDDDVELPDDDDDDDDDDDEEEEDDE